ncbi:MAG: aminotransferase, partial [Bacteroidota bacterium]
MSTINRRNWLRMSSLAGATVLFGHHLTAHTAGVEEVELPADQPIRLSSNENPYGPSEAMRTAMQDAFTNVCRYPRTYYTELIDLLAQKHGVTKDHIILTAGSTEGLKMAGLVFGSINGNIVAADPVFLALQRYAEQFGTYIHKVPVTQDMVHDLSA